MLSIVAAYIKVYNDPFGWAGKVKKEPQKMKYTKRAGYLDYVNAIFFKAKCLCGVKWKCVRCPKTLMHKSCQKWIKYKRAG